jgi:hypothetical protein
MFGLLGGSKIMMYMIVGLMIFGSVTTTYYVWKRSIKREALMEYNQRQLEQTIKDKEDLLKAQEDLNKSREQALKDLEVENQKLNDQLGTISDYLDSADAKKSDRPSSLVIRKTIEQLKERR